MNLSPKKIILLAAISILSCTLANAQSKPATIVVNDPQGLAASRKLIDSLDNQLMLVLGQREQIVKEIGIYKAKNHIAPLQAARFQQVLDRGIAAGKTQGLSAEFITKLLNAIHEESLRIERDSTIVQPAK